MYISWNLFTFSKVESQTARGGSVRMLKTIDTFQPCSSLNPDKLVLGSGSVLLLSIPYYLYLTKRFRKHEASK